MFQRLFIKIALTLMLLLILLESCSIISLAYSESISVYVNVFDAKSQAPVRGATIIIVDVSRDMVTTTFTDENGKCFFTGIFGRTYYLYIYKGDFNAKRIEYAPTKKVISIKSFEPIAIDVFLAPGAIIEIGGKLYLVELPSPEERAMEISVVVRASCPYEFLQEYGRSKDTYYLGLSEKIAIVPAEIPVDLKIRTSVIVIEERGLKYVYKEFYVTDLDGSSFILSQSDVKYISVSLYSLRRSLEDVKSKYESTSLQVSEAQKYGFMTFEERRILGLDAYQKILDAERILHYVQDDSSFEKAWFLLREAFGKIEYVSGMVAQKFIISVTNTAYISAIMALFSVVLAFFFFESERRKIISCFFFYVLLTLILYLTYPGAHILIEKNLLVFIWSSIPSFACFLFIVFGLPRIWRERSVEGEVLWRSAISIIFSMGKRQIKRKKIRGFFTILSICILILCFTSLTSFGTAFGVISEKINAMPPSEGILVKRGAGGISIGYGDVSLISSRIAPIFNVSLRLKSPISLNPIARLRNLILGKEAPIFGVLAISPMNESTYSRLEEIIEEGFWLSENEIGEVLISGDMARALGVGVGDSITIEILGTDITANLVIKGLINGQRYDGLLDIDGKRFGPYRLLQNGEVRPCNNTEIMILNLNTAKFLQSKIDESRSGVVLVIPTEIVFRFADDVNLEEAVKNLVQFFNYDVFVSRGNTIVHYHIGVYIEMKGVVELLIPLIMVILNTMMVMINSAYERSKEIRVLSTLGLNPTHIGLTFVAEAIVLGMVGGSIGYVAGLGFFRTMLLFGHDLMVREKLEWWWSALGFALAILVSLISAARPAAMVVNTYTPSKVRRVKVTREEKVKRREEIFRAYQAREFSMPLKVALNEKDFFVDFFVDSLKELSAGYIERVENIEEMPEIENVKKEIVKVIKFDYYAGTDLSRGTRNRLVMVKSPVENYYRVKLISEPLVAGAPETVVERTTDFIQGIILRWIKNKKRIIVGA